MHPTAGAQCRNVHSKEWRDIGPSWGIARTTYNDLSPAWTSSTEFRVAALARD